MAHRSVLEAPDPTVGYRAALPGDHEWRLPRPLRL